MKSQTNQKNEAKEQNDKEYDTWKENKKKKADDISAKIKKIDEQIKGLWE